MTMAIYCEKLKKQFGTKIAVKPLDLAVKRNTVYGLLGSNGAGKSTLIRMLCGVMHPTAGKAEVLRSEERRVGRERRERTGQHHSTTRRHTRSKRDWSSDVCSSDLGDIL